MSKKLCQRSVLVVSILVGVLTTSCGNASSSRELPAWLPRHLHHFELRSAGDSQPVVHADEAILLVRQKVFYGAGPEQEPQTVLTRVSGKYFGEGTIVTSRSGQADLPEAHNKLAWLVLWQRVPQRVTAPPGIRDPDGDHLIDVIVFVDARTGEKLSTLFAGSGALFDG